MAKAGLGRLGLCALQSSELAAFLARRALENKKTIPWRYVGQAFGYAVAYLAARWRWLCV